LSRAAVRRIASWALVGALASGCSGGTAPGCLSAFFVVLTPATGVFVPGPYEGVLTLDGDDLPVVFEVPVTGEQVVSVGNDVRITSARAGIFFELFGPPLQVRMRITREGVLFLDVPLVPVYEDVGGCLQETQEREVDPV